MLSFAYVARTAFLDLKKLLSLRRLYVPMSTSKISDRQYVDKLASSDPS
jgi:hypothetical protein